MDKPVARYAHLQNPDTTEIWDGGVLPDIFASLIREMSVYYNQKSAVEICLNPNE